MGKCLNCQQLIEAGTDRMHPANLLGPQDGDHELADDGSVDVDIKIAARPGGLPDRQGAARRPRPCRASGESIGYWRRPDFPRPACCLGQCRRAFVLLPVSQFRHPELSKSWSDPWPASLPAPQAFRVLGRPNPRRSDHRASSVCRVHLEAGRRRAMSLTINPASNHLNG